MFPNIRGGSVTRELVIVRSAAFSLLTVNRPVSGLGGLVSMHQVSSCATLRHLRRVVIRMSKHSGEFPDLDIGRCFGPLGQNWAGANPPRACTAASRHVSQPSPGRWRLFGRSDSHAFPAEGTEVPEIVTKSRIILFESGVDHDLYGVQDIYAYFDSSMI